MSVQTLTWCFLIIWSGLYFVLPTSMRLKYGRLACLTAAMLYALIFVLIGVLVTLGIKALRGDFG